MKNWSIRIGTFGGTEVRIHATFLLLLAFFGWSGVSQGGLPAAFKSVAFLIAMFTCVLLHEFGHVIAARRYGIKTPDITLLPIGGVARLERMPREPSQEFVVALAGPAVNVIIALAIFLWRDFMPYTLTDAGLIHGSFLDRLMNWNILMVLFNMIPAFPMDGGRVLRALLAMFLDYGKATRLAAGIGQSIAALGAVIALFVAGNPLLLIIAMFIFLSAGQEATYVTEQESMRGLLVRHAMVTDFHSLPAGSVLSDAVQQLLSGSQHDFPVLDAQASFTGMLTRTTLIATLAEYGAQHPVSSVTEPSPTALDPDDLLSNGMEKLSASSSPVLPVLDPRTGGLIGLLTAENIAEMLMVRAALKKIEPLT